MIVELLLGVIAFGILIVIVFLAALLFSLVVLNFQLREPKEEKENAH